MTDPIGEDRPAGSDGPIEIRASLVAEWAELRAIRLEMLTDSPGVFLDTVEQASAYPEIYWRARAGRDGRHAITVVATVAGRWIGTAGAFRQPHGRVALVGVYVAPRFRGAEYGILDGLLDFADRWAGESTDTLALYVHEGNARARRAYEKRGFTPTGRTIRYQPSPDEREFELEKKLVRSSAR